MPRPVLELLGPVRIRDPSGSTSAAGTAGVNVCEAFIPVELSAGAAACMSTTPIKSAAVNYKSIIVIIRILNT